MVNRARKIGVAAVGNNPSGPGWQETISERTARIELIVYELDERVDTVEYDFQNKEIEDKIYAKEIAGDIHAMKQRHDDMEYRFAKLEEQLHLAGDICLG